MSHKFVLLFPTLFIALLVSGSLARQAGGGLGFTLWSCGIIFIWVSLILGPMCRAALTHHWSEFWAQPYP